MQTKRERLESWLAGDDGFERRCRDFLGLEGLPRALHYSAHHLIDRHERSVGFGADDER